MIEVDLEKPRSKLAPYLASVKNIFETSSFQNSDCGLLDNSLEECMNLLTQIVQALDATSSGKGNDEADQLLSIQNMRIIYTLIEIMWQLILFQFNEASIPDFHLRLEPLARSIILTEKEISKFKEFQLGGFACNNIHRVMNCLEVFTNVVMHRMFAAQMLDRNLSRILLTSFNFQYIGNNYGEVSKSHSYQVLIFVQQTIKILGHG